MICDSHSLAIQRAPRKVCDNSSTVGKDPVSKILRPTVMCQKTSGSRNKPSPDMLRKAMKKEEKIMKYTNQAAITDSGAKAAKAAFRNEPPFAIPARAPRSNDKIPPPQRPSVRELRHDHPKGMAFRN